MDVANYSRLESSCYCSYDLEHSALRVRVHCSKVFMVPALRVRVLGVDSETRIYSMLFGLINTRTVVSTNYNTCRRLSFIMSTRPSTSD